MSALQRKEIELFFQVTQTFSEERQKHPSVWLQMQWLKPQLRGSLYICGSLQVDAVSPDPIKGTQGGPLPKGGKALWPLCVSWSLFLGTWDANWMWMHHCRTKRNIHAKFTHWLTGGQGTHRDKCTKQKQSLPAEGQWKERVFPLLLTYSQMQKRVTLAWHRQGADYLQDNLGFQSLVINVYCFRVYLKIK
jgi:hypothetical protein